MRQFQAVTRKGGVRGADAYGWGFFGATKRHAHSPRRRFHGSAGGGDPVADGRQPGSGRPTVENDPNFEGVVITGTGAWLGIEVKPFYVVGHRSGPVRAGEVVGRAQDLRHKYPGITNHVHLEVREGGRILNPNEMYWQCL